mgnify:CR=1 FL=1
MVNISHEILFVLRCLAYFWNSATLRELSKCILYQIHKEFFRIVEFGIYRAMTVSYQDHFPVVEKYDLLYRYAGTEKDGGYYMHN